MAVKVKVAIQKPNFYLFTGGPGAGKSTVIELLAKHKKLVVPEVARNIIRHQRTIGGSATHDGDRISYTALMLARSIEDRVGGALRSPSSHTTVHAMSHTAVLVKRLPVVTPSMFPY